MSDIYKSYGVSAAKEEVHAAIKVMKPSAAGNAFCQAVDMGDEYFHLLHADGAGTKAIIAYLDYKETGNPKVFEGIAVDSIVMNTDDMLCVGLVDQFVVSNTIGRNAKRIPQEVLTAIMRGYQQFCDEMSQYGVNIQLCGGETADVGDLVNTVIVDSTAYSKIKKSDFIEAGRIDPKKETVIVALASDGQASYESAYNSGLGSNGFTVARHEILSKYYADKYPESFSDSLDKATVYNGQYKLDQFMPQVGRTISELLLSPTRTFLPVMKKVFDELRPEIRAIIHNTGGGLSKSVNFGRGVRYVKDNIFELPFIFDLIRQGKDISDRELWTIFNCGQRLELYVASQHAQTIIDIATSFNIKAQVIGFIEPCEEGHNEVLVKHKGKSEIYTKYF
ncbi:AIR synthase related protein [Basilea psittacipulmonis]|uniref:Phosphoribosylformylglycinamidine cyclo-ligase n=1 Tax=Basilea psittacipulmonis DSM 24701 TaxID=1072685 RepID=A0A077DHF4_9BURK|nr:AIR synthase related protein [Basilea psittacipulmonis]AIL32962.1 hypothetical protein IX83_06225 [Basilea psittacipulmonis DSM 24701]